MVMRAHRPTRPLVLQQRREARYRHLNRIPIRTLTRHLIRIRHPTLRPIQVSLRPQAPNPQPTHDRVHVETCLTSTQTPRTTWVSTVPRGASGTFAGRAVSTCSLSKQGIAARRSCRSLRTTTATVRLILRPGARWMACGSSTALATVFSGRSTRSLVRPIASRFLETTMATATPRSQSSTERGGGGSWDGYRRCSDSAETSRYRAITMVTALTTSRCSVLRTAHGM